MSVKPHLALVNTETGEQVEQEYTYGELLTIKEEFEHKLAGALLQVGNLKKELAEVRQLEPEAKQIVEVLEFWREVTGHRKAFIGPGGKRWEKTRAALRKGFTVERLKAAIVGHTRDPWLRGQNPDGRVHDKVETILRDEEQIERLERLAEQPAQPVKRKVAMDLSPLEVAAQTIAREFGADAVRHDDGEGEVWATCPLHPTPAPQWTMRIQERGHRGSLRVACALGCQEEDILDALRALYVLQVNRQPGEEIAELRVRVHELEGTLRIYAHEEWWKKGLFEKDRGYAARAHLGVEQEPNA